MKLHKIGLKADLPDLYELFYRKVHIFDVMPVRRCKLNLGNGVYFRLPEWGGWGVKCYPCYYTPVLEYNQFCAPFEQYQYKMLHRLALNDTHNALY